MITSPVVTITDELLAEIEAAADQVLRLELSDGTGIGDAYDAHESASSPATIKALLAHIADLKQQLVAAEDGRDDVRLIALIGSIRAAIGDNVRLMQDELPGYIGGIVRDAERYQWLRGRLPGSAYRIAGVIYSEGGSGVDAAIDAAMEANP